MEKIKIIKEKKKRNEKSQASAKTHCIRIYILTRSTATILQDLSG